MSPASHPGEHARCTPKHTLSGAMSFGSSHDKCPWCSLAGPTRQPYATVLTCLTALCIMPLNSDASPTDGPAPAEKELALASPDPPRVKEPGREPVLLSVAAASRTSWFSAAVLRGPSMRGADGRSRSCSAGGRAWCRGSTATSLLCATCVGCPRHGK